MGVKDLLSKIGGVAKQEGEELTPENIRAEAVLPEPDFSSIPDADVDIWAKRFSLFETARRLQEDRRTSWLRRTYTTRIYGLVRAWLVIVVILVGASGITLPDRTGFWAGLYHAKFELSEPVLIAFIGTTTVNVIALFLAVTAWLFPKDAAAVHAEPQKPRGS